MSQKAPLRKWVVISRRRGLEMSENGVPKRWNAAEIDSLNAAKDTLLAQIAADNARLADIAARLKVINP